MDTARSNGMLLDRPVNDDDDDDDDDGGYDDDDDDDDDDSVYVCEETAECVTIQ